MGNSESQPSPAVPTVTIPDDESNIEGEQKTGAEKRIGDGKKKARARSKKGAQPALQTEDDKAEYARFMSFQDAVRKELGPEGEAAGEPRDESSYLFHLPSIMPNARFPEIKAEPEPAPPPPAPLKPGQKAPVKAPEPPKIKTKSMRIARGAVGKLRVHESGRTTIRWAGETFEVVPGNPAGFVQEVVDIEQIDEDMRVVPNEGGDGTSFGRIKGKFVAQPSWKAML
jgi:DNA-directed RNA polymerase III subunit RPC4